MCQYLKIYQSLHTVCRCLISLTVPKISWYWLALEINKSQSNFILTYLLGCVCLMYIDFGVDIVKYLLSTVKEDIKRMNNLNLYFLHSLSTR